jgi:hypothetical protein
VVLVVEAVSAAVDFQAVVVDSVAAVLRETGDGITD